MASSSYVRTSVIALWGILTLSAVTMLWLFWHHPLTTSICTLAVLAALGVSARLARSVDTEGASELDRGNQSI